MAYEFSELRLYHHNGLLRRIWSHLCRIIETRVEHCLLINGRIADLTRGQIVYFSADNTAMLASAAAVDAHPDWAGVVVENAQGSGEVGPIRTDNVAYVRFEAGLAAPAPAAGQEAYLSATEAGSATNAQPAVENTWISKIGVIVDASTYGVGTPFCWVLLNNCCDLPIV